MNVGAPAVGRAVDVARSVLRGALGARVRLAGPDRTEALAQDGASDIVQLEARTVGGALRVSDLAGADAPHFEGFLDGIQRSSPIAYLDGVPLLHGTAAAAIRQRNDAGRMHTWHTPLVHYSILASRTLLGAPTWQQLTDVLGARGHELRDTDDGVSDLSTHPSSLLRQAFTSLSNLRNDLERTLGAQWCAAHAGRPLYVDGSVRRSHVMLRSAGAIGVVKTHATVYVNTHDLRAVLTLGPAQRTTLIEMTDDAGQPHCHTWYLRLRSAAGRDPFFGLVRVEMGIQATAESAAEARADEVSTWLLAERSPLSRPDSRWDVMPYAIRDCEVYLRAVA